MEVLNRPGRRYRKFRFENQYDAPLLIFFIDLCIGLGKILLLAVLVLGGWLLSNQYLSNQESALADSGEMKLQKSSVAVQSLPAVTPVSAANETIKPAAVHDATLNNLTIVDAQWITRLDPNSFIVQFASTPHLKLLEEFIPVINNGEPIAIYPFKKTRSGNLVYGIATGVFDDLDTALISLEQLPNEARAYEPWVRPVKELIGQVNAVRANKS